MLSRLRRRGSRFGDEPRTQRAVAQDRANAEQPRRQLVVDASGIHPFRGQRGRRSAPVLLHRIMVAAERLLFR
jgi:hypothetical protein